MLRVSRTVTNHPSCEGLHDVTDTCRYPEHPALTVGIAFAQNQETPEQQAQNAAETWLAAIDSTLYKASWEQSSAFFKKHVTGEQ